MKNRDEEIKELVSELCKQYLKLMGKRSEINKAMNDLYLDIREVVKLKNRIQNTFK